MRRKNKNNYNKQLHVHEKFVIIIFIFLCPARHRTAIRMTWRRCWVSQCFFFLFFFLNFFFRRGIYFTSWLFAFYSLSLFTSLRHLLLKSKCENDFLTAACCYSEQSVVLSNFVLYGHFSIAFVGVVQHIWRLLLQNFVIFHPSPTTKGVKLKYWIEIAK